MSIISRRLLLLLISGMHVLHMHAQTDSLKHALQLAKEDTLKIAILSDLCFAYANNAPDSAMHYLRQQQVIADRLNIPRYNANVLNDLATIQTYKGDYSNALANNKKALAIRQTLGDKNLLISSLNKIAIIYQEQGNYEQAADYQLRVLNLAEELDNSQYIAITLNNISFIYQKLKKYDPAMRYTRKALDMATADNDTFAMARAYATIASVYGEQLRTDSALAYQRLAVAFLERTDELSELAATCNDLGHLYSQNTENDSGLYYYRRAYNLSAGMEGNSNNTLFYAANMGSAFLRQNKNDSAYKYLRMVLTMRNADTRKNAIRTTYIGMATYYITKNMADSAIHYNNLYREITDSIYSGTMAEQANELLAKYETDKKEQQIALLDKQNTIKELTIGRKNVALGLTLSSFIFAILLGILFYNRYRLKQASVLNEAIIQQQQLASKAIIAAEELERQRIARDLHDGIGQMFSAVKMNLSGIADRMHEPDANEKVLLDKTLKLVDESCKEVRNISHQMMPNVLLKSGLSMAVRDFIDKIDETRLKVTLETFGLQQPLPADIEAVLYRVIQESVNNVIKHAGATALDIQLHKDEESITVTIEDDGKGFDIKQVPEDGGIGLKSVNARVAYLNGKVDYESAPGRGTLVAIYIPCKQL
jgi:two-component system, NarL family, sensor kinase